MTVLYVSVSGSDSNTGTTPAAAKRTIAAAVALATAGDTVLLQRGGYWYEQITLTTMRGQGVPPITFGAYGAGRLPKVSQYKFANADGWENTTGNFWRIDLKDTTKFVGNQDVSGSACANVGFLRVDGVIKPFKKWSNLVLPGVYNQWDFWSEQTTENPSGQWLYVYSVGNPSTHASSIAIAVGRRLITFGGGATAVTGIYVAGIDFVGCGGHCLGDAMQYVEVTGCRMHELGGGQLYGTTRYGNGVQPGYTSDTVRVHHNWIYDVYDTATTTQGNSYSTTLQGWKNIEIDHNWISRCEQSWELYAMDEPGSGGTGAATTSAGALTAASVVSGGTAYYAGQLLRVIGGTSGASNGVVSVTSVGSGGALTALAISTAGSGYTSGEALSYQAITWALDSTKGLNNVSFHHNVCFDIGYGPFHASRPDQNVASPLLFYSVDAGVVDVKIYGNQFYNFRGPLITSGSGDDLADLSDRGYKVFDNFVYLEPGQKVYNLSDQTAAEYADWAADFGMDGTDLVHAITTSSAATVANAIRRLADMSAVSAAEDNLMRDMILSLAGDVGKLDGTTKSIERREIFGNGAPSLTADFAGQLYIDLTGRKAYLALDQSGGTASWKRFADVTAGSSDPTYAASAIGELFVNTSAFTLHYAINTSGTAAGWRRVINVIEQAFVPGSAPSFVGRILVDTGTGRKNAYIAVDTASSADWKLATPYTATPPAIKSSSGVVGQYAVDANYFYVCRGSTWERFGRDTSWT